MSRAVSAVSGKPYGLAAVCRVWRLARFGVYRHQSPPSNTPPGRRGPVGPMSDAALVRGWPIGSGGTGAARETACRDCLVPKW
jgi:hypothetical protein